MVRTTLRRIGIELVCFGLFALVYYAPFILELSEMEIAEPVFGCCWTKLWWYRRCSSNWRATRWGI